MTQPRPVDSSVSGAPGPPIRLARWHRRLVVTAALALAATGLLWMLAEQALGWFPALDDSLARSRMHLVLTIHGVLAYGGAVLLGSLLGRHVPAGLRSGRRTGTGITALSLVGALVLTALLLYYAGSETLRSVSSVVHQVLGVAAVAILCAHINRRERPRTPRLRP